MTKKITITIVSPEIITSPPQQDRMDMKTEGLLPIEVLLLLSSAAAQIASKELPLLIESIKMAQKEINPMGQIPGKA